MEPLQGLGDVIEQAMKEIRKTVLDASRQTGAWESFKAFTAAVDWREPWLVGVLSLQALLLLATIVFRNSLIFSGTIMALSAAVIYGGERLNAALAQHWRLFAAQPYFDSQGIFFGAVISAPLLLNMFILLVNYLVGSSKLLVRVKRKELMHKARQRARRDAAAPVVPSNASKKDT